MNELPSMALVAVLEQLTYPDLVRYRLVNKLWRQISSIYKLLIKLPIHLPFSFRITAQFEILYIMILL